MKQHGVIQADSVEETVDSALLFLRMPVPGGKNVGIIGVGGGTSVQATDECVRAGLAVPLLPKQTRVTLSEIYGTEAGRIFRNPVDLNMFIGPQIVGRVVKAVAECEAIDLLLMHVGFDTLNLTDSAERRDLIWLQVEFILSLKGMVAKPVAVVMHSQATDEDRQLSTETQARLNEAGFVVFPSFRRAAAAISRHIWYQSWRGKNRHSSEIDM